MKKINGLTTKIVKGKTDVLKIEYGINKMIPKHYLQNQKEKQTFI